MSFIDAMKYRWRAVFRHADLDREMDEEMRHYAELERRHGAGWRRGMARRSPDACGERHVSAAWRALRIDRATALHTD